MTGLPCPADVTPSFGRRFSDICLIGYRDGAHIPPHVEAIDHGHRRRRLNALVAAATSGGELRIDRAPVELAIGDAVMFYSDVEVHEVTPVVGTHIRFSVGVRVG